MTELNFGMLSVSKKAHDWSVTSPLFLSVTIEIRIKRMKLVHDHFRINCNNTIFELEFSICAFGLVVIFKVKKIFVDFLAFFILINFRTDYRPSSDILELFLISCLKVFQFVQVLYGWDYGLLFLSYLYFKFNRVYPFPALFRLRFTVRNSLFTYVVSSISSCS